MTNRRAPPSAEALDLMSTADFVSAWCSIVGEPPAILLENRGEMIRILAAGTTPLPAQADEHPGPLDVTDR